MRIRVEWHVLQNKDVIVHWHDQPEEFGKKVFDIATRSIQQQRDLYGTDLQYPAQIVIENTDEEFMSWQFMPNPDTGGLALPWYGMTIQVVEDSSEDWLNEVLPHEISHLYFFQVTINGDAWPALWLDEGLAVYYEFGEHQFEDLLVRSAVLQDRLIPLLSLRKVSERTIRMSICVCRELLCGCLHFGSAWERKTGSVTARV
jgi:hypothetical protein